MLQWKTRVEEAMRKRGRDMEETDAEKNNINNEAHQKMKECQKDSQKWEKEKLGRIHIPIRRGS